MIKGGYKIIDFKGKSFTSGTEATIAGVYEAIESTNKMTVVSGLVVGTTEYDDVPVFFTVTDAGFYGYLVTGAESSIAILVADDDGVTVTVTTGE